MNTEMESLAQKYIANNISTDEAAQVLDWLQTIEGEQFMINHIDHCINFQLNSKSFEYDYKAELLFNKIKKYI